MSIELIKEPIKINQTVGKELVQFSVQGDVIVPDVKPDIMRVLWVDSEILVNDNEVQQDNVIAEGMVNFKIIYLCNDPERAIRALNASLPFKEAIDSAGTRAGMRPEIDSSILNTEFDILNERKILVKAIAQLNMRVINTGEIELVTDVMGEGIQKLKDKINICSYIGENSETCIAKEEMELPDNKPPIFEVLRTDCIVSKDVKISDDQAAITGEINVSMLYAAEDEENSLQVADFQVPYTQMMDIPGLHEGVVVDTNITVKDVDVRVFDDEAGDARGLEYEITMGIDVKAHDWIEKEVILDTYNPQFRVEMESKDVQINQLAGQVSSQAVVKHISELENEQDVNQIYEIFCKPYLSNISNMDDKILLEGLIDAWILYCAGEENNLECNKFEVPFNIAIDAKGAKTDMLAQTKLEVEHCGYNMLSGKEIEIRAALNISAKVFKDTRLSLINKVNENTDEEQSREPQPSITIYYVQPGDTLWNVGKRFNTTLEELTTLNELNDSDELYPGQQVIIQKKMIEKNLFKKII